ncbi:MAG: hypothetical protein HKP27_13110 [Myxococcales bacterium]|nr:hypothetical protein [Myxococcales bacterium]
MGSRIREGIREHGVYGEKNLTYGPFVALLYELFDAKFVFIRRDGRDVVRSLIDWHDRMFGSIYRECRAPGNLTPRALEAAAGLLVHEDSSDFSRPRPLEGAPWYDEWDEFSRFEMCAYYWDTVNRLYADRLELLPKDAWIDIDYTSVEADDVMRVASFCGLEGLDDGVVETMLTKRINSLAERVGDLEAFPGWENWDPHLTERYWRIAGETMRRFGYRDPR